MKRAMLFFILFSGGAFAENYAETANWELSSYDSGRAEVGFQARPRGGESVFGGYALIQKINGGFYTPHKLVFKICPPAQKACYWGEVLEEGPDRYGGGASWVDSQGQEISPPKGGEKFVQKIFGSARAEWPRWAKEEVRPYLAFLDVKI